VERFPSEGKRIPPGKIGQYADLVAVTGSMDGVGRFNLPEHVW
jgi:hypothetical protein